MTNHFILKQYDQIAKPGLVLMGTTCFIQFTPESGVDEKKVVLNENLGTGMEEEMVRGDLLNSSKETRCFPKRTPCPGHPAWLWLADEYVYLSVILIGKYTLLYILIPL